MFEIGETKDDGTPWCVWSAPFTPSYHENSALRPFLRKWIGRELSPAEVEKFDVDELVGRPAQTTVIHEHSDGEIYANIALIMVTAGRTDMDKVVEIFEYWAHENDLPMPPNKLRQLYKEYFGEDCPI